MQSEMQVYSPQEEPSESQDLIVTPITGESAGSDYGPDFPRIHPNHDDLWMWEAIYNDGTTLPEIEGTTQHFFSCIDQARLVGFVLRPLIPGYPQFGIQLGGEKRLIFVRRRIIPINNPGEERKTWHILGWQRTVLDMNFKYLTYIQENGDSFTTDNFNAI